MGDINSTMQIVPISMLNAILYESDPFTRFISFDKYKTYFNNIELKSYLDALNNYMKILIKEENNLSSYVFDRMNYINTYYHVYIQYDFVEYINKTAPVIPLDSLNKILNDDNEYNKFINYNDNIDYFAGISLNQYLTSLNDLMEQYNKSSIEIPEIALNHYNEIMRIYALDFRKQYDLEGYRVKGIDLNPEFVARIMKSIDPVSDKFTQARGIYLELARTVNFDETFVVYDQDTKIPAINDIYHKNLQEINLNNNELVCKTWSEVYVKLLSDIGIDAVVCGSDMHKWVEMNCDGTLIKADATNMNRGLSDGLMLNDFTRAKAGLETVGFTCPDKDISIAIENSDTKLKSHKKRIDDDYNELLNKYATVAPQTEIYKIKEKLYLLELMMHKNKLTGFDAATYIKALTHVIFDKQEREMMCINYCGIKVDDFNYKALTIVSMKLDEHYIYYGYSSKNGFHELSVANIQEMLASGLIKCVNNREIPGVRMEKNNGMVK